MPRATSRTSTGEPSRAAATPPKPATSSAPLVPAPPTPSAQIDALTGDPDFMTSLARGLAGSDDNRHFYLRPRVLALGHSYISSMPLATAAQPILEHFSRLLHESCSIATLDGLDIVYVARANVTRLMAIDLGVGSRLPV